MSVKVIDKQFSIVRYHGIDVPFPFKSGAIATDRDGEVFAYESVPPVAGAGIWIPPFGDTAMLLMSVDLGELPWNESLMEVK